MNDAAKREEASVKQDAGTRLAFERTYLAHERPQMAWVRTTVSLMAFGFAISKYYEYLHNKNASNAPVFGPQTVGIFMLALGEVFLALAVVQYWRVMRKLREQCPGLPASLAGMQGGILAILGFAGLADAILRAFTS